MVNAWRAAARKQLGNRRWCDRADAEGFHDDEIKSDTVDCHERLPKWRATRKTAYPSGDFLGLHCCRRICGMSAGVQSEVMASLTADRPAW